jgi:hypothetical protein
MSLSEIKNKLYKKELDKNLTQHDESEFDARVDSVDEKKAMVARVGDDWMAGESYLNEKKKSALKVLGISLGVIIGILAILVAVYQIRKSAFNESRVTVSIDGPMEVKSGKLLTYEIAYNNNNRGTLKNAVLRINHPVSFKPEESTQYREESPTVSLVDLGDLPGYATGKIVFGGRVYAPKGTLMYIKNNFTYTPNNFNSQFSANSQLGINVISSPITFEVMGPQNLANGDSLDYQITYKNDGEDDFENIRIKADFQDGFTFSRASTPPAEGNNTWYIGHLSVGEEGKIIISGKLQGQENSIKKFVAHIGTINQDQFMSYNEEQISTRIVASPLTIAQTVNGMTDFVANAGDELKFEIQYKNNGDVGLRDVIVKETLDSPILDYGTLVMDGGSFNTDNKTIEWKAVDYPELANLAVGQTGKIQFSIKVKNIIPIQTSNDKNFVISSIAKIDSPDVATPIEMNKIIAGNKIDIKLKSKLILAVTGYYTDSLIENTGPIPPIIGEETSYTMHLKIGNVSNDITDAKVDVVLPTGAIATGKIYPTDAKLDYNERTNALTWNVGNMKVGEGILTPLREVAFQIKIKPAPNQAGQVVDLINSAIFSAKDSFTGQTLSANSESKNTMLREDQTISQLGWKVSE